MTWQNEIITVESYMADLAFGSALVVVSIFPNRYKCR